MGRSKAWLPFGDEWMLQRVVRLVGMAARPIVVVAAVGQELPELPVDVVLIRDPVAGRGPLQGLAAGLNALPDSIELVYATATDVPFLEPRLGWPAGGVLRRIRSGYPVRRRSPSSARRTLSPAHDPAGDRATVA